MPCKIKEEDFIEKSKLRFGNKISYEKFKYINCLTKSVFICYIHGEFIRTPFDFINSKYGCIYCGRNVSKNLKKTNQNDVIKKFKEVNGDVYDYSKFIYNGHFNKGIIICKMHGEFLCTTSNHKKGRGCPKCAHIRTNALNTLDEKDVISKFLNIHGYKYEYENINYIKMNKKINIYCKIHGYFQQTPVNHIKGQGCPICNESYGEKIISKFLKSNNINFLPQKKFNDCIGKGKRKLPFDFYLIDYNICIEYDGTYHFPPSFLDEKNIKYAKHHTYNNYLINKINDDIKTNYCKDNNITLIRISFLQKEIINNILEGIFKKSEMYHV